MFPWSIFLSAVLLVSVVDAESKGDDESACYKNEKNLMLWDMAHYCISKARDIYLNNSKEFKLVLSANLKREKSLPYLEKAKELIMELEENYLIDEPSSETTLLCPTLNEQKPFDCSDILSAGHTQSGLYTIWPADKALDVYCDMDTDGGGWTVIQRRGKFLSQENFFRGWNDYENGFGDLMQEFWLGNKNIYLNSNQSQYEIRFDLTDFEGNRRYAEYKSFWLDDANSNYTLHIEDYNGNAGDSMAYHNNHKFSTRDTENSFCAKERMSGWWFDHCTKSNLNGVNNPGVENKSGMTWYSWHVHTSLAGSEIKLRKS